MEKQPVSCQRGRRLPDIGCVLESVDWKRRSAGRKPPGRLDFRAKKGDRTSLHLIIVAAAETGQRAHESGHSLANGSRTIQPP